MADTPETGDQEQQEPRLMICPRCSLKQPLGPECRRCGLRRRPTPHGQRQQKPQSPAGPAQPIPRRPSERAEEKPETEKLQPRPRPTERTRPRGAAPAPAAMKRTAPHMPMAHQVPDTLRDAGDAPLWEFGSIRTTMDIFMEAWSIYRDRFWVFTLLGGLSVLTSAVPPVVLGTLGYLISLFAEEWRFVLIAAGAGIGALIALPLTLGMIASEWAAARDDAPGVGDAIDEGFARLGPFVSATALSAMLVTGGLVLGVVPGIALAARMFAAPGAAVDGGRGGLWAIERSAVCVRGYGLDVGVRLGFLTAALSIVPLALFPVTPLTSVPWISLYLAVFALPFGAVFATRLHYELLDTKGMAAFVPVASRERRTWLIVGGAGWAVALIIASLVFGPGAVANLGEMYQGSKTAATSIGRSSDAYKMEGHWAGVDFEGRPGWELTVLDNQIEIASPEGQIYLQGTFKLNMLTTPRSIDVLVSVSPLNAYDNLRMLGVYDLRPGVMHICLGGPARLERPKEIYPIDGVKCLKVMREPVQ